MVLIAYSSFAGKRQNMKNTDDKYKFNGEVDLSKPDKLASKYLFNGEIDHSSNSDTSYRFNGEVD
jgi:hypothetical protein